MAILKHNVLDQENDSEREGKYKVQHCWGFVLPFVPSTTQHPNLRDSLTLVKLSTTHSMDMVLRKTLEELCKTSNMLYIL